MFTIKSGLLSLHSFKWLSRIINLIISCSQIVKWIGRIDQWDLTFSKQKNGYIVLFEIKLTSWTAHSQSVCQSVSQIRNGGKWESKVRYTWNWNKLASTQLWSECQRSMESLGPLPCQTVRSTKPDKSVVCLVARARPGQTFSLPCSNEHEIKTWKSFTYVIFFQQHTKFENKNKHKKK